MDKLKCIVVDDSQKSIDLISKYIQNHPCLELIETFINPLLALEFIYIQQIELVFVDIQMPEITGLDFMKVINNKSGGKKIKCIITTGYFDYAVSGFELGAIDYLVKPINYQRFCQSVERVIELLPSIQEQSTALLSNQFIFIEKANRKDKINLNKITLIEACGNYIQIYTEDDKYIVHKTMNSIIEQLNNSNFLRVHKSFIVSINHINSLIGNEINIIGEGTYRNVPIGVTYKEKVFSVLNI